MITTSKVPDIPPELEPFLRLKPKAFDFSSLPPIT